MFKVCLAQFTFPTKIQKAVNQKIKIKKSQMVIWDFLPLRGSVYLNKNIVNQIIFSL